MRTTLLLAVLLTGCWKPRRAEDPGTITCVDFDDEVTITVVPEVCISSSCSRNYVATCTAVAEDGVIEVRTQVRWGDRVGPMGCTDDCGPGFSNVVCSTTAEPGTWTVVYGDSEVEVELPSEVSCSGFAPAP